ncbi:MAG: YebC/PmpR family DNA-binding regulatory protein, partial [Glaciecola sp.]
KEITIATRDGGPDPETNPTLRVAIKNAKGANMPKDTMERAIKKGSGADAASLQEMTFEGYAAHGIAVFVECTTDNLNRTVSDVRAIFTKYNGALGTNGSLSFMFNRKGVFTLPKEAIGDMPLEELEMSLIDGGLEELEAIEDEIIITCGFEDFGNMNSTLDSLNLEADSSELQRLPTDTKVLSVDHAKSVLKMIDAFDENDDVNSVFHSMELTDDIITALEE